MESGDGHRSGLLVAGGILSILGGILQMNTGGGLIGYALTGSFAADFPLSITFLPGLWPILREHVLFEFFGGGLPVSWVVTGGFFVVVGIAAVVGGISAIRRKRFGLSLAGAICTLLSGLVGIMAIVFVAVSKKEFEGER